MTDSAHPPAHSLACRDLGFACEWAVRSKSDSEIRSRFAEHAKCAHSMDAVPPEFEGRLQNALRTLP
jgi:predicted small metal-binding protein